ncbi:MAG: DNA polymerase III subunit delta [Melioribacter sp.]|nr:DNA polymerase III subunit delta [Melioribacter sp.]
MMVKKQIPTINNLFDTLSNGKFLPVYFICGEDSYNIDFAVEQIIKKAKPVIQSDFDIEIIDADKGQDFNQIIDIAYAYPFGGSKKLIIVKNFEKINDKKLLVNYLNSPADFTILVLISKNKINDFSKEPYATLIEKNFLYEAKKETGEELINWLNFRAKEYKLNISKENLYNIIEIVGEDKSLLESQLKKISDYTLGKKEITIEEIKNILSTTKQYSVFDLIDSLGKGDKIKSIEIGINLLDGGEEIVVILNMIAKFILTVSQILELTKMNISDNEGARKLQVSWYYYTNCKKAKYFFSDERLLNASRALLEADTAVKTTTEDPKNILIMLITRILT